MALIYLDYNATTPLDPSVAEVMRPFLSGIFGNPSSIHEEGIKARKAVELARKQIAELINCHPDEIIFTSGGSEANNLAIKGMAYALRSKGNHIITSCVEHPAVTEVCKFLEKEGFKISYLPVDEFGMIDPEDLKKEITPATILISVMHANNETGTIQPVRDIGEIAREEGIIFHTDAAQSVGKTAIDVKHLNVDLLSIAGHKLYAPKGVGALYIRRGIKPVKLIHGADHEQNLRAGTENVMSIAGLGEAASICSRHSGDKVRILRDKLFEEITKQFPEVKLNGHPNLRLPNTLNISFPGVEASLLLSAMKDIAASAGAACHAGSEVISPVLKAMGVDDKFAMGSIRFSLGRMTSEEEIEKAIPIITCAYRGLSGNSSEPYFTSSGEIIKLTQYTHSLGCACKINPAALKEILKLMPSISNPSVLVGFETSDDAAVYRINDKFAIVQTVDMIPPVVDDPYSFGSIAAANALSDVYAMGGVPLFALSIVGFPINLLPSDVLHQMLKGANDKVAEAGIQIIGGHSIEDTEPKFGLVVTGSVDPEKVLRNSGAKPGDAIILTKPLGTGIISTGIKRGIVDPKVEKRMVSTMSQLNKDAAEIMSSFPVSACTDVTGFGLLGHLIEMIKGSGCGARITFDKVPLLPSVIDLVTANIIPGGTVNNLKFVLPDVEFAKELPEFVKIVLADAQTSGGLLIAIPGDHADELLDALFGKGLIESSIIGTFIPGRSIIEVT